MVSSSAGWTWPSGREPPGNTDTPMDTLRAALLWGPKYECQVRPGRGTISASGRATRLIIGYLRRRGDGPRAQQSIIENTHRSAPGQEPEGRCVVARGPLPRSAAEVR